MLYLPLAALGMQFFDAAGIFAAYAVANVLSAAVAYGWAKRTVRAQCNRLAAEAA